MKQAHISISYYNILIIGPWTNTNAMMKGSCLEAGDLRLLVIKGSTIMIRHPVTWPYNSCTDYHIGPGNAKMRLWTGSWVIQLMACCLFGAKSLPPAILTYTPSDPQERIQVMLCMTLKAFPSREGWKHVQNILGPRLTIAVWNLLVALDSDVILFHPVFVLLTMLFGWFDPKKTFCM